MLKKNINKKKYFFVADVFILIALLWIFWIFITGDVSFYYLFLGAIIAIIIGLITRFFILKKKRKHQKSLKKYLFSLEHLFGLLFTTIFRLIIANLVVIYQAFTLRIHPQIVKIKVNVKSDLEITLISTLITLTPGTLVIDAEDAEDGGSYLFVHFSYLKTDDPKKYIENTIGKWDSMIGALFK